MTRVYRSLDFCRWLIAEYDMIPEYRIPAHPGEVLAEEFLKPMHVTQTAFAAHLGVPARRISDLLRGKRAVTPEVAWLLSKALNTSPEFWTNLQTAHDNYMKR